MFGINVILNLSIVSILDVLEEVRKDCVFKLIYSFVIYSMECTLAVFLCSCAFLIIFVDSCIIPFVSLLTLVDGCLLLTFTVSMAICRLCGSRLIHATNKFIAWMIITFCAPFEAMVHALNYYF